MARFVPVPGHAAVAHLSARPFSPVLGTLPPQDMQVLRCAGLDPRLLVNILGNLQPADTLRSAEGRMQAIAAALPCRGVLLASTALWVHVGGPAPDALEVSLPGGRRSRLPYLVTRRGRLPHCDTTVISGITCATIARAAVDIARLGPPVQAVQAIMAARDHGVSRVRLLLTLNHCRGAASRGCPRAQHIIEEIMAGAS
ncbi:hypothetical protein BKH23_04955 [Actinomyces oris]|uniref:hypothetical protein n=1 Tax=Actinomyces TaxID=1654 RepID=UPI00094DC697|nr:MULTISPECIES: hypothetical protein [Actinomyces]OLO62312.1 hypothetical protein BKH23_04955 [Actinomyces oris]